MSEKVGLKYGDRELVLSKSDTLIALRQGIGMDELFEGELASVALRRPAARRGRLDTFELLEFAASPEEVDAELDRFREQPTVEAGSHVYFCSDKKVPFVPTGEILIVFKHNTPAAEVTRIFDEYALELVESQGEDQFVVRISRASPNPLKVAKALQSRETVEVAEPDLATFAESRTILPSDDLLGEQWHLRNVGYHRKTHAFFLEGADARVVEAWQRLNGLGSSHVVVGVIDDGFDLDHPDLHGKAIHPWDFQRNSPDVSPVPNLYDHRRGDWHGTSCAGVAVGRARGGRIVGAAPEAALLPVRWGRFLSDRQIELWFDHMAKRGADIVSCSWGAMVPYFPLSYRKQRAIRRCANEGRDGKGCVVVFAAGNANRDVNDPANQTIDGFAVHPDVIAVAASTSRDRKSHYSNYGDEIWVCAPSSGAGGAGILTADVRGTYVDATGQVRPRGYVEGGYYWEFGGTSSACPLVAGVCALMLSANAVLTAKQVKEILAATARKIGDDHVDGHSRYFGYGCINAEAAVQRAMELR